MRKPDTIVIDGQAFSWKRLCELRKAQLERWRATQPKQPALFELREDARPKPERSAEGRYQEPSLLDYISN